MRKTTLIIIILVFACLITACSNSDESIYPKNTSDSTAGNPTSTISNEATSNPTSTIGNETTVMPNHDYIGTWHNDEGELKILEINNNTIKFELGIFRITTIYSTAQIENNKIKFVSDDEPKISGAFEFSENSILVTIEESDFEYIIAGTTYNFTNQEKIAMPDQSYIGTWYNDDDDLKIIEINSNIIKFELSIYRISSIYATTQIENTKIRFIACGADGILDISGTFYFNENSIWITIDELDRGFAYSGDTFYFDTKK